MLMRTDISRSSVGYNEVEFPHPTRSVGYNGAESAGAEASSADVDDYVLQLRVEVQRVGPELPAPPALLETAPRGDRVDDVVAVHVNRARLERVRHAVRAAHVLRPHARDQAVHRILLLLNVVILVFVRELGPQLS